MKAPFPRIWIDRVNKGAKTGTWHAFEFVSGLLAGENLSVYVPEHLLEVEKQRADRGLVLSDEMAFDIMTNALEMGSDSWSEDAKHIRVTKYGFRDEIPSDEWRYFAVDWVSNHEEEPKHVCVTVDGLIDAWPAFTKAYPHLGSLYAGEYQGDAISDDAFFQFVAFGDVVYG